ncbi:hypothetical protein [Polaromonas jejuensis]|uniref:Secreted protein n=1 Tax=Polaromonas jejuensis TaxID=457502 RepID=A0ABW0Q782_9BURK|nr:hypothetical protein [Polaromonas jejuensis]
MQAFKTAMVILLAQLLGVGGLAHAESTSGSFGVTIVLRTFSEAATADHRCTHRRQAEGQAGTLSISCPATVDVQAIASAFAGKTGQYQRMVNGVAGKPDHSHLAVMAGQPMNSADPIELTISW